MSGQKSHLATLRNSYSTSCSGFSDIFSGRSHVLISLRVGGRAITVDPGKVIGPM